MKYTIAAGEDDFDYENSHDKVQEFSHFLHYICNAKEIEFVGYNSDTEAANVGVDAAFIFDKNSFRELVSEHNPEALPLLDRLYENLTKNIIELKLTHAMQEYINDVFPNELFYFAIELNYNEPRFTQKGLKFNTPQQKYLDYDHLPIYQDIQKIGVEIFYNLFRWWFRNNYIKETKKQVQKLSNDINELKQFIMRDNIYEQEIVIERIKHLIREQQTNQ